MTMRVATTLLVVLAAAAGTSCKNRDQGMEHLKKGNAHYAAQKLEEAIKEYDESLAKDSTLFPARLMKGKAYFFLGKKDEAQRTFEQAAKDFPGSPACHYWLGRIYLLDETKLKEAESNLRIATEYDDSQFNAHYYLGKIYEKQGKVREALVEYNRARLIKSGFDKIHRELGNLYQKAGLQDRAREEFAQLPQGAEDEGEQKGRKK